MREILIRSYDAELESFYYFFNGKYYSDKELKNELEPSFYELYFNWNNSEYFTGILDKNGNKIFEGDKVKFHYFYQGIYSGGAIECEKEVEGVIEITSFGLFLKCENPDDGGYLLFYQPHEESFEIIGNIH